MGVYREVPEGPGDLNGVRVSDSVYNLLHTPYNTETSDGVHTPYSTQSSTP